MKTKILILGSRGQLGRDLLRELEEERNNSYEGIDIEEADITNKEAITEAIMKIRPEIVINTAAYTDVENCEADTELAMKTNAKGAGNVAEACKKAEAKLIHISTDYVFNGEQEEAYVEDSETGAINTYGKSKEIGEKEVLSTDKNFCIVRTAFLYGISGSRIKKTNCVENFIKAGSREGPIRAVDGLYFNTTYARQLAKALIEIAKRIEEFKGIHNITSEGVVTWPEFAKEVMKNLGIIKEIIPITPEEGKELFKSRVNRPVNTTLTNIKAAEKGIRLPSWKIGLKEYFNERNNQQ